MLTAADGEEAVRVFRERGEEVRLLLLDMVMPKKSGKDASGEIRRLRPSVRVLYMSGHTPDSIASRELLEPGMNLLPKPLSPPALLQAVRRVLDT